MFDRAENWAQSCWSVSLIFIFYGLNTPEYENSNMKYQRAVSANQAH